jgi:hypothetical protein
MSASCKLMPSAKPKAGVSDSALITLGISLALLVADSKAIGKPLLCCRFYIETFYVT